MNAAYSEQAEAQQLALRRGRFGFVLVCIATAAATGVLILDHVDPYADNVPGGVFGGLFLTSLVLGPFALGLLLTAAERMAGSSQPVPWQDWALVIVGIILAGVGAVEMVYMVLSNLGGTL